jgi:arginase
MDLGAGRRGVDMGPSALRVARLQTRLEQLGYKVEDRGNVAVDQPEARPIGSEKARYLAEITRTSTRLSRMVENAAGDGLAPLVLGGDHSAAIGTVAGLSRDARRKKQKIGLLWIDAHADMNTPETSPSGNIHGMPLACCVGLGPRELTHINGFAPKVDPRNVALVGLRCVDQLERPHVRNSGVRFFTMRDIDERGLRDVMSQALRIVLEGTAGFHLSLDMDAVDPHEAPGVGTPVKGGLTYRESHLAMEIAGDTGLVRSMELVEVNPVLDVANRTADLAVELIMSAMGKRIL